MITTLKDALPGAEFVEYHSLVIDASPERVWQALTEVEWADLRWTKPFIAIRMSLGGNAGGSGRLLLEGPVDVVLSQPGSYVAGAKVAQPWRPRPAVGPRIATLDDLAAYDEGTWLKYGLDFALHRLPGDRTRLDTSTLCEPTDDVARRRFRPYWWLIRPFSGLIRREMLRAVARRARRQPVSPDLQPDVTSR